ncbi:MAG: hypothetical protein HGA79_01125 [Anaerolineales bacterium]|nr:hypothetical protein [Anaerolineales bacterium]
MKKTYSVQIFMTNKMSRRDFINSLMRAARVSSDVDLAKCLGVTKQKIGYWKQEENGLDIELLLQKFGPETIDYLKNRYEIGEDSVDDITIHYAEVGKKMTEAIRMMIANGLISVQLEPQASVTPARQQAGPGPTVEQVEGLMNQGRRIAES